MRVLLIDACHIMGTIYSSGMQENITEVELFKSCYGSIKRAINTHQPTHLLVAFDDHRDSWRRELLPSYKRGSGTLPMHIEMRLSTFFSMLNDNGIPHCQMHKMDSKDIIGTICGKLANKENIDVTILGAGKRFYPMLSSNIKLCHHFARFKDEMSKDLNWLTGETGLTPKQWSSVLAIAGATPYGVPGIPRMGEKTAIDLIKPYTDILELSEFSSLIEGKRGQLFREHMHDAINIMHKIMGFKQDIELGISLKTIKLNN